MQVPRLTWAKPTHQQIHRRYSSWLQLKSDTTEILGVAESRRKKVYKINIITNEIVETYENLSIASIQSNIEYKKLSNFILTKTKIENYIYSYDL